jgi:SHS2 domain-containing protein
MKRQVSILIALLVFTTVLFAHGNEQHVMGTVTEVSERSITVETKDKQKVTVTVVQETQFMKGASAETARDLKVGDRVVIHAVKQGEQLQAHTVRIGTALPDHGSQNQKHSISK